MPDTFALDPDAPRRTLVHLELRMNICRLQNRDVLCGGALARTRQNGSGAKTDSDT
jgi:hypothetical protein